MIEAVPFSPVDALMAEWREKPSTETIAALLKNQSYTVSWNKEVVGILTLHLLWEGIATAAAIVSEGIRQCPVEFTDLTRELMIECSHRANVRKVYSTIDATISINVRWAERVGFIQEYVMREAGPEGQDMIGYAFSVPPVADVEHSIDKEIKSWV